MAVYTLIANSGLQFMSTHIDVNPDEPLVLPSGRTLRYTFIEAVDFLNDCRIKVDVCAQKDGFYVPVNALKDNGLLDGTADECGVPKMNHDVVLALVENYASGSPELMNINSLSSLRLRQGTDTKTGFELLLGKWLPMPMYESDVNGLCNFPNGWCRVRIDADGEKMKNGYQRFRFTWAFDTQCMDEFDLSMLRPSFPEGSPECKHFSLCSRADLLLGNFLTIPDGVNDAPVSDYLLSHLGIDLDRTDGHKYKFMAYYIYLINYLRLSGAAPEIALYNKLDRQIPVDMSVDIGNSRTCAVLFEKCDFTKAGMLRLRDMSEPWRSYENAFDMRVVFRKADFGGDISQDKKLFQYPSLVRVGEEAKHLIYMSLENNGESGRTTNYSSPKRYLWDKQMYGEKWEYLVVDSDSTSQRLESNIFIEGFTDYFDADGSFLEEGKSIDVCSSDNDDKSCRYSRSSLMTFVMIEVLQQSISYINSHPYRNKWGDIDCRRYLRSIIVTCPTAMPLEEQHTLRKAALDATLLLRKLNPMMPEIQIIPDPEKLKPSDDPDVLAKRGWLYDEAFANQLVYLYAELVEKYGSNVDSFFNLKGHFRKDMEEKGYEGNSLTIGTIDIGAGTTDVMITAYGQKGRGKLTPVPLYYDSFYSAGDDIIRNIIRDIILEGRENKDDISFGCVGNSLKLRILQMSPDELLKINRVKDTKLYCEYVENIRRALTEEEKVQIKMELVHDLMHHFFSDDNANMSQKDRRIRLDFSTQISIPMAQFFMEQVKQNYPAKNYTFKEIFPKEQPAHYLLDAFEYHFGFRFEELLWAYNPEVTGRIIADTMESLVKSLSVAIYAYNCDVLVFSGRPTGLRPLTELLLKYIPIAPHKMVLLNQYHVGKWYPLATPEGYFIESQKAIVAVGAEVGHLASTDGFKGLVLDFSSIAKTMKSTAKYIGFYDSDLKEISEPFLTPNKSNANLKGVSVFPCYIGCKQFDSPRYQARPLYAIYNRSRSQQLNIMLGRNYYEDREKLTVEDVTDSDGENISISEIELRLQTLAGEGSFWMDNGAFTLNIQTL